MKSDPPVASLKREASEAGRLAPSRNEIKRFGLKEIVFDVRVAIRSLRKAPAFSLSVVAILSIVIAVNASVFTALYDSSLKPLPYAGADRITYVYNVTDQSRNGASRGQYFAFKEEADLFEAFALTNLGRATVDQERISGLQVTEDFFKVLGVAPLIGRFITAADCEPGAPHVVALPEDVWRTEYNGDPNVIGQTLTLGMAAYEIVGVAPESVSRIAHGARYFQPFTLDPWGSDPRSRHAYIRVSMLARLKPGIEPSAGLAQLSTIERRFLEESAPPELRNQLDTSGWRLELGLPEFELKNTLIVLQAGAALLLVAACLNLAGLMVSRASQRSQDLSVRHALGAGRAILLRMMLVESALLVAVSAVIGVGLAYYGIEMFNAFTSQMPVSVAPVQPQFKVFAAGAFVLMALALIMGSLPFAVLWRSGMIDARHGGSRTASRNRGARLFSGSLVVIQMAFSAALLIGAGLLGVSYHRVLSVDPGFNPSQVMSARVAFSEEYDNPQAIVSTRARMVEAVRQIPGVDDVAFVADFPIDDRGRDRSMTVLGAVLNEENPVAQANLKAVSHRFFETLGISLREGETFSAGSGQGPEAELVVDRVFAERYFQPGKAVGSQVRFGASPDSSASRIIGVVERANIQGLQMRDGLPFVYYPFTHMPNNGVSFVLRTSRPTGDIVKELRQKLAEIDPNLPLYAAATLDENLGGLLRVPRMVMRLVIVFAAISLLISIIGLYSLVSYDVAQRGRELCIRVSLGASPSQIIGHIMKQAVARAFTALALGLVGAYMGSRLLQPFLFDTTTTEPGAYIGVSLTLAAVALLAAYLPARRAANADPIQALRSE